ncbi:MAG: phosphate/sulfate permease [Zhongshania sp.]
MLTRLAQFGLPIWFITSFSLWIWLPTPLLLAITPFVSAALLTTIGGILGIALYQLYSGRHYRPKSFYSALGAALLSPPVAIIFAYKLVILLNLYPLRELAALAWFLSSMGAVLTVIVVRLMSDIISAQPRYTYQNHLNTQATPNQKLISQHVKLK